MRMHTTPHIAPPRGRPPMEPVARAIYDLRKHAVELKTLADALVWEAVQLAEAIERRDGDKP